MNVSLYKLHSKYYAINMLYSAKELIYKYGNDGKIYRLLKKNKLFRVGRGIYSYDKYDIADIEKVFIRHRHATLTNESAYAFYNLSTYIPEKYQVSFPLNAHKTGFNYINQLYMQNKMNNIGRVRIKTDYGYIYIYDKERMLIELFRNKYRFSYEYYKEIVSSYRKLVDKDLIDVHKVSDYCNKITYGKSIFKKIQEVIL